MTASDSGALRRWGGPLVVAAAGVAMLAWTWRAWPDPVVDFGRELYVPWRLAQGDVLFRDIAWFNGPLSAHWNAGWFRLAGPGLMTLVGVNLALLVASVVMLYRFLARVADRGAATVGCALFLLVFAFGQYVGIANYNWLCPYSHEATHGLTLALVALVAAFAWSRTGRIRWAAVAGLAVGLAFLTKVETFLAALAACAVVLAPALSRREGRAPIVFAVTALVPPVASTLLLGTRATLGAWPAVVASEVAELPFYRAGMGLDRPAERAGEVLRWTGGWLLVLAPAVQAAFLKRGARDWGRGLAAGVSLVVLGLLFAFRAEVRWLDALRPLPLFTAIACVGLAVAARRDVEQRARWTAALAFAVLALTLLAKMILNARVTHYGFVLALPATLLLSTALVSWLPALLDRAGAHGIVLRCVALTVLGFGALEHVLVTGTWLERKTTVVGTGRDAFRSDVRGELVNEALASVRGSGAATLGVLPEGVMLNYLARLPNPTPYVNFMPPEAIFFGADAWTEAFRAAPPDVILVVPKDTSEYGRGAFGDGYGRGLAEWVGASYRPVSVVRRQGVPFEIRVLALGQEP